jgi:hypothetical protein
MRPYLRNTQHTKKRADRVEQVVVKCLPSKHEALNSNPNTKKIKIKKTFGTTNIYLYNNVFSSTIHYSQKMETTLCPSTDELIHKM